MSKKKFSTGSTTMTLKDFHGGSIPSDLLLPSAPGISSGIPDRPSAWISAPNSVAASTGVRADPYRSRPGSSGGRPSVLDDRSSSFLSSTSLIGRHFEEDERKPFEASSGLRRPSVIASEPIRSQSFNISQVNPRPDSKRPLSSPMVAHHLSASPGVSTSLSGNAWASRKDASIKAGELPQTQPPVQFSGPTAASRFAQASAIEKVSSGRWQTKTPDVEVIKFQDMACFGRRSGESGRVCNDVEGDVGRVFSYFGVKEGKLEDLQSDCFSYPEIKERNSLEVQSQPKPRESRSATSHHQYALNEASERPKLKLLQRTKPLEPSDSKILNEKQGSLYSTSLMHMEESQERNVNNLKPKLAGADAKNGPAERPKLNLKPRSQSIEQRDESSERKRQTVFGGARPREFVLKERAVDGTDSPEITALPNWIKPDFIKNESKRELAGPCQIEEVEPFAKVAERKDHRPNSRINENWRGSMKTGKKPIERLPEPETWRKPAEPIKPETPPGPRTARATSALELAQVFSRPMSDSRVDNHYTNQTMLPSRAQIPFSRLTDTREHYSGSTYRHINGY